VTQEGRQTDLYPVLDSIPTENTPISIDLHETVDIIDDVQTGHGEKEKEEKEDVKRSEVWNYFQQVGNEDNYKCTECGKIYPNKKGWGTKNLIQHLKTCSALKMKDFDQKSHQMILKLEPKGRSNLSEQDQKEADLLLVRIIVEDERPFSFPQSNAFKNFCTKIAPDYKIPCDNTIDKKFEEEYKKVRIPLDTLVSSLPALSLTMDGWKSNTGDNYASFEVHFWDFKLNKKTTRTWNVFVIDVIHCTGEVLQNILQKFFQDIGWDGNKIDTIVTTSVTDGGGNI
jgi:hypothetical protein